MSFFALGMEKVNSADHDTQLTVVGLQKRALLDFYCTYHDVRNILAADLGLTPLHVIAAYGPFLSKDQKKLLFACYDVGEETNTNFRNFCKKLSIKKDIHAKDYEGWTPLYVAIMQRNVLIAKMLVDQEERLEPDFFGRFPLHWACALGNFALMSFLFEHENYIKDISGYGITDGLLIPDSFCLNPFNYVYALRPSLPKNEDEEKKFDALEDQFRLRTRELFKESFSFDEKSSYFSLPRLHRAIIEGKLENVIHLINENEDYAVDNWLTPLHVALTFNFIEAAEELLKSRNFIISFDRPYDAFWDAPSLLRLATNNLNILRMLIDRDSEKMWLWDDSYRNELKAILIEAIKKKNTEMVIYLMEQGFPVVPHHIWWAVRYGNAEITDLLLSNMGGDIIAIEEELFRGWESVDDSAGDSLLHIATKKGNSDTVRILLKWGAAQDVQDTQGKTALHYAHARGDSASVRALEDYGFSQGIKDKKFGLTPKAYSDGAVGELSDIQRQLYIAAVRDQYDLVCELLAKGAEPWHWIEEGCTALHGAVKSGNMKIVKELLKSARAADTRNPLNGKSIWHYAFSDDRSEDEVIALLNLFKESLPTTLLLPNFRGITPLHLAIAYNCQEAVALLLGLCPDLLHKQDRLLNTPLHVATSFVLCEQQNLDDFYGNWRMPRVSAIASLLLTKGAGQGLLNFHEKTALHEACFDFELVQVLLADNDHMVRKIIDAQDAAGNTALHIVCTHRLEKNILASLLKQGASVMVKNL